MKPLKMVLLIVSSWALFSCLKAGDGVGLTQSGAVLKIDSCKLSNAPSRCVVIVDSCKLAYPPAHCTATIDSCTLPNPPDRCTDCTKLPKSVKCLDKDYFTANVLPIFKNRCESCHNKLNGVGYNFTKLTLESTDAWDSLVNVDAYEMVKFKKTNMLRVKPGMPDSSFLYIKIFNDQPPYGQMMPADGSAPLSDAEILVIKNWITGRN